MVKRKIFTVNLLYDSRLEFDNYHAERLTSFAVFWLTINSIKTTLYDCVELVIFLISISECYV